MGLRVKVALWVLMLYLLSGGLSLWLLRVQVLDSYGEVDRLEAVDKFGQLLMALEDQFLQVDLALREWSNWDDLLLHVRRADPAFAARNLSAQALEPSNLVWLAVHRQDGSLAVNVSAPDGARLGLPGALEPSVQLRLRSGGLAAQAEALPCGLARAGTALMMLCQRPLLGSSGQPAAGAVAVVTVAVPLGQHVLAAVTRRSEMAFTVRPVEATEALAGEALAVELPAMAGQGPLRMEQQRDRVQLSWPLRDISGVPVAALEAGWPRREMERGKQLLRRISWMMAGLAAALALGIGIAIDRIVVVRLARLGRQMEQIQGRRDWLQRVSVQGQDEISALARGSNEFLGIIAEQVQTLERLSQTDPLTGLSNRRGLEIRLQQALRQHRRDGRPLCLLMADVDFFKAYNDRYGHQQGDQALKVVADCLSGAARRPGDMAARLGGEEFAVVLADTDLAGARRCAESLQQSLRQAAVVHEGGVADGLLTVSLGVALAQDEESADSLYRRADEALYRAKQRGRNRLSE